jgi:hypothetical protein
MSAIGVKADIDRARSNVPTSFCGRPQRYGDAAQGVPCAAFGILEANRASARYYDRDLRVLSRGIFQQT